MRVTIDKPYGAISRSSRRPFLIVSEMSFLISEPQIRCIKHCCLRPLIAIPGSTQWSPCLHTHSWPSQRASGNLCNALHLSIAKPTTIYLAYHGLTSHQPQSLMITCALLTALCLITLSCRSSQHICLSLLFPQLDPNSRGKSKSLPGIPSEDAAGCGGNATDLLVSTVDLDEPAPIDRSNPSLPIEMIERIADFLFEIEPPPLDRTGNTPITSSKPVWSGVEGFMQANLDLHNMGFLRWLHVITVKDNQDWKIISQNMRVVRCVIYDFPPTWVAVSSQKKRLTLILCIYT